MTLIDLLFEYGAYAIVGVVAVIVISWLSKWFEPKNPDLPGKISENGTIQTKGEAYSSGLHLAALIGFFAAIAASMYLFGDLQNFLRDASTFL